MHFTTLLTYAAVAGTTGLANYVLEDDYMSSDFFGEFSFWTDADPTNGFVEYVDQGTAQGTGLISNDGGKAMMGVNNTAVQSSGRQSVRLTSTKSYQSGLIVIDVAHMPGGVCGTWPAFWTVGPDWPNQGEIDIIEGVNDQTNNDMTLHTGPGCTIANGGSGKTAYSGSLTSTNCVSGSGDNTGCQIQDNSDSSYGSGFNSNGGGVFAMDWTSSGIAMYFFPRGSEPDDCTGSSPNPSSWGEPVAYFSGGCDISSAFTNQQIVFDTTFCGDWAGQVWDGSTCAKSTGASTCEDFVANNPSAFKDAYWSINALKVYQNNGGSSPSSAPAPSGAPSSAPAPSGAPSSAPAPSGAPSSAPAPSGQPSGAPSAPASSWGQPSGAPSYPASGSFVTVPTGSGKLTSKPLA
jgi:hypothetical protein